jgi:CHAT domain-containing protein
MQAMADFGIEWPRLPMTGDLARNLKNASPDTTEICEGAEASKSNLLNRDLSAFRNILFATHGYAGSDIPDLREPALVLTTIGADDGFVRMSEAMGLKINSDVVVLLACQTGLGRLVSGEGPMGLGRAFQYAGAKSVIISLWSVAEKTSVSLAESFFKHVRAGKSRMEALAAARAEIRDDGYDHPFFWAPFILVGETLDTQAR